MEGRCILLKRFITSMLSSNKSNDGEHIQKSSEQIIHTVLDDIYTGIQIIIPGYSPINTRWQMYDGHRMICDYHVSIRYCGKFIDILNDTNKIYIVNKYREIFIGRISEFWYVGETILGMRVNVTPLEVDSQYL